MATNQKANATTGGRFGMHRMAIALETLAHQLLGLTGIEKHLKPGPDGHRFQGKPGADEVDRTGGSPQIQGSRRTGGWFRAIRGAG
jgi:hypothetical protein